MQRLDGPADWAAFQAKIAAGLNASPSAFTWGRGPAEYPCLADACSPGGGRVLTCFVYQADARRLLGIAEGEPAAAAAAAAAGPAARDQDRFNRSVAAQLLAIQYFMVETGICKKHQLDAERARFTHLVDQWTAEDRDGQKPPDAALGDMFPAAEA